MLVHLYKLTTVNSRDYPSNNRENHKNDTCDLKKLRTKDETWSNHMDYFS
ncbi:hypothetical protein HanXRQr2_Chr14g0661891 [Helianthus annuus]|uniref:Uncharacterized protein n=1 Tax=Helianthus annuus TaxID=4232 RepID=A0A9K3EBU8_HELAN|nr:hypothetical protein HanXRQr2_Chr14g0661891 [Helianthus annuus]